MAYHSGAALEKVLEQGKGIEFSGGQVTGRYENLERAVFEGCMINAEFPNLKVMKIHKSVVGSAIPKTLEYLEMENTELKMPLSDMRYLKCLHVDDIPRGEFPALEHLWSANNQPDACLPHMPAIKSLIIGNMHTIDVEHLSTLENLCIGGLDELNVKNDNVKHLMLFGNIGTAEFPNAQRVTAEFPNAQRVFVNGTVENLYVPQAKELILYGGRTYWQDSMQAS